MLTNTFFLFLEVKMWSVEEIQVSRKKKINTIHRPPPKHGGRHWGSRVGASPSVAHGFSGSVCGFVPRTSAAVPGLGGGRRGEV